VVSKEAETMIEDYLKKVDKSMTDVSKTRRQEILKTLRSHIMDALEDQKGRTPEARIVKNTIKDLGTPKKKSLAQKVAPWIIVSIVCLLMFIFETVAGHGYTFTVLAFVWEFSALGIEELWTHNIEPRFDNKRINVVGLWLAYIILVAELFLLGLYIDFPVIGSTSILNLVVSRGLLIGSFDSTFIAELLLLNSFNALPAIGGFSLAGMVALFGGILAVVMSGFIIIAPEKFQSKKRCPNCGKKVEGKAKFCWNCGEAIP
jgi:hypothetical protein